MIPAQLYSRILPHVQGCPDPLIDQAVMDSVIELAKDSKAISTFEAPIPLVNNVATYSLTAAAGMEAESVLAVFGPNFELRAHTPTSLADALPDWQTSTGSEPAYYSAWNGPQEITVYPRPVNITGQTIRVRASWRPTMTATSFPDDFGNDYFLDIVNGALFRLKNMRDVKWQDREGASFHKGLFDKAKGEARIDALAAGATGTIVVRPQRFGS